MREDVLFSIDAPYREHLPVRAWHFGAAEKKTLAVMGALRGNEVQQMYACALLIQALESLEAAGQLSWECGILIVPCANQFSMNVGRRFWAADNTDINRMFPGYDEGETTQRIAARIFQAISDYEFGVHFTSFYLPGSYLPHVRMLDTGYQHEDDAADFGLPYAVVRTPQPYDTTTLNYNWQIWNTRAFSIYTRETERANRQEAQVAADAVLRFLYRKGCISSPPLAGAETVVTFREERLVNVLSGRGGLLVLEKAPGDGVEQEGALGSVIDPCSGRLLELLRSPCAGRVFFTHHSHLINGHDVAFRILPEAR